MNDPTNSRLRAALRDLMSQRVPPRLSGAALRASAESRSGRRVLSLWPATLVGLAAVAGAALLGATLHLGHIPGRSGAQVAAADLGSSSSTSAETTISSTQEATTSSQESTTSPQETTTTSKESTTSSQETATSSHETSSSTSAATGIAGEPCLASHLTIKFTVTSTGNPVVLSSSVTNSSDAPCVLVHVSGGSPAQVCGVPIVNIYDQTGQNQLYSSKTHRADPKCASNLLQPGGSISQTDSWNTTGVAPGTYDAQAEAIGGLVKHLSLVIGGGAPAPQG